MTVGEFYNPHALFYGAFVPDWLLRRKEVSAGAKLCFGLLCKKSEGQPVADPELAALSAELGVSDRQVRSYLNELRDQKLIAVNQRGQGMTNEYSFIWHEWTAAADLRRKHSSDQDRKYTSGQPQPERNDTSGQGRKNTSGLDRKDTSGAHVFQNLNTENERVRGTVERAPLPDAPPPVRTSSQPTPPAPRPDPTAELFDRAPEASPFTDEQKAVVNAIAWRCVRRGKLKPAETDLLTEMFRRGLRPETLRRVAFEAAERLEAAGDPMSSLRYLKDTLEAALATQGPEPKAPVYVNGSRPSTVNKPLPGVEEKLLAWEAKKRAEAEAAGQPFTYPPTSGSPADILRDVVKPVYPVQPA